MCGINGFNFKDKVLINLMNKTIKHRGPDDDGIYLDGLVSLGHLRLSIQDLSIAGHQPMSYAKDNLQIVFNGEIYNFIEIKKDLIGKGYKFKSECDTEVIMASYLEWGYDCVKKFNGMWAFCIYDKIKNKLFLSRDRFGKKPLYYYFNQDNLKFGNKFIFSSEIKSILSSGIKKEVDTKSFREFFTYRFSFGDSTMIKNIFNFKPGFNMIYDLKKNFIEDYFEYYKLNVVKKDYKNFDEVKKKTYDLIESSVKKRMVSDVPVACLLSGGIDSSIITYFAKKYNKNLNTFSIGFDTTNELSYAKLVAVHFRTNHHEFKINKDNILEYLDEMVYHMDEPIGADPGFLPIFVLSKEVSKYNKVVLSGDGADEIFFGYDRYKLFHYGKYLKHFAFFSGNNEILKRLKSMRNKDDYDSFIEITRVFEKDELESLGIDELYDKPIADDLNKFNLDSDKNILEFDIKNLLVKDFFMKADKMSSAFGLEQRTPFMDYKLVEFALGLDLKYKLNFWNEKYVLKEIFKDILPKEISKRRKHGFNVPIDYWFENVLGDELRILLETNNHDLYDNSYVYKLLDTLNSVSGGFKARNVVAQKLWTVLIFEKWYKRFMQGVENIENIDSIQGVEK